MMAKIGHWWNWCCCGGFGDMKKYKAEFWCGDNITVVDVVRETKKFVTIGEQCQFRDAQVSSLHSYHDTPQEAKDAIIAIRTKQLEKAERNLCNAMYRLRLAADFDISHMVEQ
jgi:hypothetical protein